MRTKKVGWVPVVDKEGRLKGVVSLMGIVRKIKDSSEKTELEYKGEENIINTLHALANRKQKLESINEFAK
ncbi:MAG TPA: CBS domain-containing protein [Bacteroidia bacterium]|nr:CBS domain-containing protein [Bacteroidia bacterium]